MPAADSYPTFAAAVDQLKTFLATQEWPTRLAWVRQQGVVGLPHIIAIRRHAFESPDELARNYDRASQRRLGVLLEAVAHDGQVSYCHLWAPDNADESIRAQMPDGLKLSVRINPPAVSLVGPLRFAIARRRQLPGRFLALTGHDA